MPNVTFKSLFFLIVLPSLFFGENTTNPIVPDQTEQRVEKLLGLIDQTIEKPAIGSFTIFTSALRSIAKIKPEVKKYFELEKTCFTSDGLKVLIEKLRKTQIPNLDTIVCDSVEEWSEYLKNIYQTKGDVSATFILVGSHCKEMQKALLHSGKMSQEHYDLMSNSNTAFHMTPAFVHKTEDSLSIYFTDSLGFAPSIVLKSYCYFLGSFEMLPNTDVYIYPSSRQRSDNGCSIFSLLDCINFIKHPSFPLFVKEQSKPAQDLWGDNGYLMYINLSESESIKMNHDTMNIYAAVFEEYKQYLEDKGETVANLVSFNIGNEDMMSFMYHQSNAYKPFKEKTGQIIQGKMMPHVKNVHMHTFSVLPPSMMQYTQSFTSLNKYMNENPSLICEYDKNSSGISYKEEIQRYSEGEEKPQNKMMEHYFKKYARLVLKEIL